MEISRDCKDFLASFDLDLGTSCRHSDFSLKVIFLFVSFVVFCRFRLMEIRLNIWNASTWQCWWFTTWRCRWSERRRMDGRWFWHRATQTKKLSIFSSQSPNGAKLRLCAYNSFSLNSRILIFWVEVVNLCFLASTSSQKVQRRLKTWNFCTASRESFEFCWRWDRFQGMLMKEKMRGLRWWKLKKVTERKKHEVLWQKMVRKC